MSLAISALLCDEGDVDAAIAAALSAATYDTRVQEYIDLALGSGLGALDLGAPDSIGYTLKAFGAGLWVLKHASSYEDGVLQVIHEGGDADTNAAVVGALLGARFGFAGMPAPWIIGLVEGAELQVRANKLMALVG